MQYVIFFGACFNLIISIYLYRLNEKIIQDIDKLNKILEENGKHIDAYYNLPKKVKKVNEPHYPEI